MPDPRHALGREVEDAVAEWLTRAGWTVLARRIRSTSGGEVDIVALDPDGVLVAVEVRARRHARTGSPVESVDGRRIGRARRTLAALAASAPPHRGLRVDLVAAEPSGGRPGSWRLRRVPGIEAS
ncbi:MAG TPA: YraN family protein [Candidatus Limnocylindria bacterium]|nr:YraN family protein [Candidatus Limnocylindria bacterium]